MLFIIQLNGQILFQFIVLRYYDCILFAEKIEMIENQML